MKVSVSDKAEVVLSFQNGRFFVLVPDALPPTNRNWHIYPSFRDWYIAHGTPKVQQRVDLFAPKLGVTPTKIRLKEQQARWGSCTKQGELLINWKLMMAPMKIIDYVMVHEIAHLLQPNHNPDFWNLVASVLPDYQERKEWLRIHGPLLEL